MNRLLVVAPYSVVPPRYGGPLRVYNLCRELSRSFAVAQFAQQVQRRHVALRIDPVISRVTPTYWEYSARDPLSIGLYTLSSLRWGAPPVWQDVALRLTAPHWLRSHVARADLIHVEHPWQFAWVHRQTRGRVPIVLGTQNDETLLYPVAALNAPGPIARRIVAAIDAQQRYAIRHASHVVTCSPEDSAALIARYGIAAERCTVVPNGVDCHAFGKVDAGLREQRKAELGLAGQRVILFAGSQHRPNVDAVARLIELAQSWAEPNTTFLIVGTVGNAFAATAHPALRFTGSVESTRHYFEAADLAINPMLSGSGTNLKQLEFMAMGLPVLTTPIGVRGIPVLDGEHVFIRHADAFAAQLRWMLANPAACADMGLAARRFVEQRFDWAAIADRLAALYRELGRTTMPVRIA